MEDSIELIRLTPKGDGFSKVRCYIKLKEIQEVSEAIDTDGNKIYEWSLLYIQGEDEPRLIESSYDALKLQVHIYAIQNSLHGGLIRMN